VIYELLHPMAVYLFFFCIEAPIGDTEVHAALLEYHRRNITNKDTISQLLKADHNIILR